MTDILQRLVDTQLDNNCWQWGWAAEAADEIRKLRLEYDAMVRSRDDWQALCAATGFDLEAMRSERDSWQALAAAADADKRKADESLAAARAELAAARELLLEAAHSMDDLIAAITTNNRTDALIAVGRANAAIPAIKAQEGGR